MKNGWTTFLGIGEAFVIGLTPEVLIDQPTWKHRAVALSLALLRATFGVLAADARGKAPPDGPPSPAEDPRRVG